MGSGALSLHILPVKAGHSHQPNGWAKGQLSPGDVHPFAVHHMTDTHDCRMIGSSSDKCTFPDSRFATKVESLGTH